MLLDPRRGAFVRGLLAGNASHVVAQNVEERRARARQFGGQRIDICIRLVADDEPVLAVEHRKAAPHVVEGCLEARIELFQGLVALQNGSELLLESILQMRDFAGREGLMRRLAA